ncbi:MAG: TRASH domain-containing protein, partial [Bdellovibrionales bacterium]
MAKILLPLLALLFTSVAIANPSHSSTGWKVVPNKEVCMVTDMHFAKPQIPVEQGGKIYYGCCQNCKTTLQKEASSRTAEDPVSKKTVDKATATIAASDSG